MTKNILSRIKAREQAVEAYAIKWEKENKDKHNFTGGAYGEIPITREQAYYKALHTYGSEWDEEYNILENKIIAAIKNYNAVTTMIPSSGILQDILLRNLNEAILTLSEMLTENTKDNNVQ